jgi:hypothetical protein
MRHWRVRRSWDEHPDDRSVGIAYARCFATERLDGGDQTELTIEFVSARDATVLAAQYHLVPYLEAEDRPPRRILVGPGGKPTVREE